MRENIATIDKILNQAAHGNASITVVEHLIAIGAWRTLKNADGETPIDIARRKAHNNLMRSLAPVYKRNVSREKLQKTQAYFHTIIHARIHKLAAKTHLRLPKLEPLLEIETPQMWFPVPEMYGGFKYWLENEEKNVKLISESWCRVVERSGQRHEITSEEGRLVEHGFI